MTWKTPRGVLQAILSPNLSQARALTEGEFPTALLENRALVAESRNLSPRLSRTMEAKLPDEGHIRDRMRRVLAYWGDRERADTMVLDSGDLAFAGVSRSEEHTSELQSLMRISYAVFCLKKKKNKTPQ